MFTSISESLHHTLIIVNYQASLATINRHLNSPNNRYSSNLLPFHHAQGTNCPLNPSPLLAEMSSQKKRGDPS